MEKILSKLTRYFGTWRIGVLDEAKDQLWKVEALMKNIPYLKAKNAGGRHIFMQPVDEGCFIMADDLNWGRVQRNHQTNGRWKPGRMCVETSPGNFQVWIHSDRPLTNVEKSYWLERLGSDPDAGPRGRWGRCPGFRNRKPKHRNDLGWPLARLIWVDYLNQAHIPLVDLLVRTALPLPSPRGGGVSSCPSISRSAFDVGDDSRTDFRFVLSLLRRGVPKNEVCRRLRQERTEWSKHARIDAYIQRTVAKAKRKMVKGTNGVCPYGSKP